jgi:hypothetical protein
MTGDVGESLFARADRPREICFDEIEFVANIAERIVESRQKRDFPFAIGRGGRFRRQRPRFALLDQIFATGRPEKIAGKMS